MSDIGTGFIETSRLTKLSGAKRVADFLLRWESMLFLIFILVFVGNSLLSPYFLDPVNLFDTMFNFMEKAVMSLPMMFVILLGDIDISVSSIISLSSLFMGMASAAGADTPTVVAIGLAVGLLAGLFNGLLITKLAIPSIAVTLGSSSLFRGIANAVLGDKAYTKYPASFAYFGQGYLGTSILPFQMLVFLVMAVMAGIVLNKTVYGRHVFAVGNNKVAARFSGVPVDRVRMLAFAASGLAAGIAAIMLTSRIGSTRPNIASGWDTDVITIVVLGGVAITGGKGNIAGVIISNFLLGYMKFGMGVLNVPGKVMNIITGVLLVVAILLPKFTDGLRARLRAGKAKSQARNREIR
ncbi:MAG TPA: ABC transporter permease [Rectinemataceae bacterium]|nr:ABC transporter permease [Rectinemataceae bacterium]